MQRYQRYIDYINATARTPLPIADFDSDWEPIGPEIRSAMADADITQERAGGIYLRPDLCRPRV